MSNQTIELAIKPGIRDLGEFAVRRALPDKQRQRIGPFIFFDHMGPADFAPGEAINVRSHPHIGLATITYLFEGEILHRDNLGYVQPIQPGAVNWMTAGRGIVHSEKVTDEVRASGQHLHGLQTWVALPTESEEIEPRFEHYPAADIPRIDLDKARATVIIGEAYGARSPVKTESETLYIELDLEAGASIALPETEELGVYVVSGAAAVNGERVEEGVLAALVSDARGTLTADAPTKVMLCGGAALDGKRYIWWNYVSSSRERIEQAKVDWREKRFAEVPGETDFIPLPER